MTFVVDENVLIVANDLTRRSLGLDPLCQEASDNCGLSCAEALLKLIDQGGVGLDDESEVFEKYLSHCSLSGQPGIGDAFMRAVFERGYVDGWAERVAIRTHGTIKLPPEFIGCGFDNDDHVWVAIAFNSLNKDNAVILNAVDSDYKMHAEDLAKIGVVVNELCAG